MEKRLFELGLAFAILLVLMLEVINIFESEILGCGCIAFLALLWRISQISNTNKGIFIVITDIEGRFLRLIFKIKEALQIFGFVTVSELG